MVPSSLRRRRDADGYYSFTDLPAGDYQARFVLPGGYVGFTTPNVGDDATDSDADPASGLSHIVTLAPGGVAPTIDAGLLVEVEPQVIEELPETGYDSGWLAFVGSLALGLGGLLLLTTRRREEETA